MKRLLLLPLFLLFTAQLSAQETGERVFDNTGFFGGFSFLGTGWSFEDIGIERENGGGIGLKLGYNFNPSFGVFASLDGSRIDPDGEEDYALGHFDIGIQGFFRTTADRVRPFVRASLLGMSAQDDNIEINGGGIGLGAGTLIFVSENLAFDLNLTHSWINVNEVVIGSQTFDADERATTTRLFIGLNYHF